MEMIGPQSNKYYKHQVPHHIAQQRACFLSKGKQQTTTTYLFTFTEFFFVMMMFCLPGIPSKDFDQKHQNCLWALKPMDHS